MLFKLKQQKQQQQQTQQYSEDFFSIVGEIRIWMLRGYPAIKKRIIAEFSTPST